ncbi:hypothetical protein E2C01_052569 [Portunus trituberculatus]|uniref:Uncharacterized protein n=1 Tax=Portunus trituberculatus TaxID=210409 RepID=A0A5B7GI11_PORTR|nr:hypothetical protein [Portunus trituberculatus]
MQNNEVDDEFTAASQLITHPRVACWSITQVRKSAKSFAQLFNLQLCRPLSHHPEELKRLFANHENTATVAKFAERTIHSQVHSELHNQSANHSS